MNNINNKYYEILRDVETRCQTDVDDQLNMIGRVLEQKKKLSEHYHDLRQQAKEAKLEESIDLNELERNVVEFNQHYNEVIYKILNIPYDHR